MSVWGNSKKRVCRSVAATEWLSPNERLSARPKLDHLPELVKASARI